MNKTVIERLIAVNWRTSLIGFLETVTGLTAAYALLPDSVRKNPWAVTAALLMAALKTAKESQTKDKQVTGTPSSGYIVGAKMDEEPRYIAPPVPKDDPPPVSPSPKTVNLTKLPD